MITRRRNQKQEAKQPEVQAETPIVETPASTESTAAPQEIPVEQPKAKKVRYAPVSVLVDNAVITYVKPNPKRGESSKRYAQFYRTGVSVAELVAEYKAANKPGGLARLDLRWDVQHGNIQLGLPQSE